MRAPLYRNPPIYYLSEDTFILFDYVASFSVVSEKCI